MLGGASQGTQGIVGQEEGVDMAGDGCGLTHKPVAMARTLWFILGAAGTPGRF